MRPADGAMTLFHLANLYPEKDAETVLDAISLLNESGIRCRLHLAGSFNNDRHKEALDERIARRGIENCVVIHGGVGRAVVQRLLREAHIGLLSSKSKGLPNSVMEDMYRGLPVVATDIPGLREVVGEGNTKWLSASEMPLGCGSGSRC